jgi:chorismate mutase
MNHLPLLDGCDCCQRQEQYPKPKGMFMMHVLGRKIRNSSGWGMGVGFAILCTSCATTPIPVGLLEQPRAAISLAEDAGAERYAPVELGFAKDALGGADVALAAHKVDIAIMQAERAKMNAELAQAKAQSGALRARLRERENEVAALRERLLGEQTP